METNENLYEIDLKRIFTILLANWLIIAIVAVLFGAGAFAYTKICIEPVYASKVTMYVNNYKSSQGESVKINYTDISAAQMLVKTYTAITTSDSIIEEVIDKLEKDYNLRGSVELVKQMVSVQTVEDTEIFEITVKNSNPEYAYKVAKSMAKVVPKKIPEFIESSSVKIIDDAELPTTPISPNVNMNTVLGILAGIILSVAFIFLREFFDLRIKNAEDLTARFQLPVLGNIPEITAEETRESK